MTLFTPVNVDPISNGALYAKQLQGGEGNLDVFALLGLPADGPTLDLAAVLPHYRKVVIPCLFERGVTPAETQGPDIPTGQQENVAQRIFQGLNQRRLTALQTA